MTGLSIKTLSEALARVAGRMTYSAYALDHHRYDRYERLELKLFAALAVKSERMEALERVAENGDRLMRAADIVRANLAHPEGAHWPFLYDLLRSRMYTYTEARDGIEAAQRYGRAAMIDAGLTAQEEGQ